MSIAVRNGRVGFILQIAPAYARGFTRAVCRRGRRHSDAGGVLSLLVGAGSWGDGSREGARPRRGRTAAARGAERGMRLTTLRPVAGRGRCRCMWRIREASEVAEARATHWPGREASGRNGSARCRASAGQLMAGYVQGAEIAPDSGRPGTTSGRGAGVGCPAGRCAAAVCETSAGRQVAGEGRLALRDGRPQHEHRVRQVETGAGCECIAGARLPSARAAASLGRAGGCSPPSAAAVPGR